MTYKVTERLYRSRDGKKVVLEKDVRALTLIATPGDELPEKPTIEKLDTGQPEQKAVKSAEDKKLKQGEDKGVKQPALTPEPPPPDDPDHNGE
ncbi:MAG: hypothetical protein CVU42_13845 [Chloroflexi bacterium HGW-Chloroflexi-4]|nr:MAG: hypothetical protein CVU42_13845 [Chloroflexi bacterium HGW-Chloroflexi-4]